MQVRIQPDRSQPAGPKQYSCREGGAGNPAALGGVARSGCIAAALWLCVAFAPVFAAGIDPAMAREFWSLRAPRTSRPPEVRDPAWARSDVDRFVLGRMERAGLKPAADADPATLLRRVTFDLSGLPPEAEDVERFLRDPSAAAYEKIVDVLLAAPEFGERWGRHWLDVARYGESTGKERNFGFPEAWRYRDWVIDAVNADQPYDAFVREQVAGDLLPARDAAERNRHLVATGFLAIGPKGLNERRPEQFAMDVVDEQIDVTTRAVLGMNIACARCHDHKSDPVTQRDYYALAGVFRSTTTLYGTASDRANRHPSDYLPLVAAWPPAVAPAPMPLPEARPKARRRPAASGDSPKIAGIAREAAPSGATNRVEGPRAMGVREARPIQCAVLAHGDIGQRGAPVPRGFVDVVLPAGTHGVPRNASGRRELADWLVDRANPLAARVQVNRVWLHLFGRGLVSTPDNFGRTGLPPSHPELLDALAVAFMDDGWSVKRLVRRLVLSRVYQLDSRAAPEAVARDPDNVLLSHASFRRLDAEEIRDAMLSASGLLDLQPPHGSPVSRIGDGPLRRMGLDRRDAALRKRSVYLPVVRGFVPEAMELFDFAEPSLPIAERDTTNVPAQALYLMNGAAVDGAAHALARRAAGGRVADRAGRIRWLWLETLGRAPSPDESRRAAAFLDANGGPLRAWPTLAQSLLACAEFRCLR